MFFISSFRDISARNLHILKAQPVAEISGSLGDLGTFLPIAIALSVNGTISLSSTLVFSGIANILTGLFFGIPLPVQPMKAIAAVAIANSFTNGEIAAAGIFVAACIFVFSVTSLLRWFADVIPIPVVKGIQVGAGLSLIIAAGGSLSGLGWITPSWADNRIWAIAAFFFLLVTNYYREIPYALVVLGVGLVFAIFRVSQEMDMPSFRPWIPILTVPGDGDWRAGIVQAGIGQLPLTTLNSVVAVVHLAGDLLPDVTTPSITSVGLSISLMNLVCCWFGAMPVCHGSGGLAAQFRFGARSGSSVVFLGVLKLLIGLFCGNTLVGLLKSFPYALLGIMVIAAGLELASVGESLNTTGARDLRKYSPGGILGDHEREIGPVLTDDERKKRFTVMMVTIGFLVGFKNDAVGFIAGMLCHWSFQIPVWLHSRRHEGRIRLPDLMQYCCTQRVKEAQYSAAARKGLSSSYLDRDSP
ncbi:sulfate transporter, putative [Talaromyces stipitatus ATCC 10500]|uniref:Sulfate transporter, putative n=1 Tax=Talaromyces stipitatus (strain ATCC 10500 / CBS 375.48 / QM 6759 / NRRL 1006) TaxID=441959 RepID=B8M894_TALSN|nr:sulfate transporter, putative [Talaromyces stipitatus ATCC 10500]EED20407.1 sulfate transporter, putative [Talaromyces stipitatus ATCC 10500]